MDGDTFKHMGLLVYCWHYFFTIVTVNHNRPKFENSKPITKHYDYVLGRFAELHA